MTKQQLFTAVFFVLLLFLLYQIALMFRPFLLPVLWAALLAHLTFPLHVRLTSFVRGREIISASCLTVLVLALVVIPISMMGVLLAREASTAEQTVREWISSGALQTLPERLRTWPVIGGLLQQFSSSAILTPDSLEQGLLSAATFLTRFFLDQVGDLLKNAFLLVTDFFLMLFALFFLFKDGKQWLASLQDVIPLETSHKQRIVERMDQTVRAVVKGIGLTAIVQGLAAGLAYMVLEVPFPVVLTAVTVMLAPLPFGGTALVWVPVALYFLAVGPLWKALAMLGWGVGVVSMIDQFLRPWLIGQAVQIPVLFLVFSVLGGLALYGLIGLFVGPVLVSLLMTSIQIYREEYHQAETTPPASPASPS
ncbi:MAG TPA: AI-2E family transporter [Nitrospiraceae bacterium]|nr:AI-2E family transporter [Nitrospiraceae bacterium]